MSNRSFRFTVRVLELTRRRFPPALQRRGALDLAMQGPRSEGKRLWDRDKQCYKVNLLSHHILRMRKPACARTGLRPGPGRRGHGYRPRTLRVPPLYEDGPDNGTWNFDRYYMPLASDVVVWQQTAKVLPALSETDPPKGWQRWQMIPIISALVSAIAHVTGQRFRQTSVTAEN